MKPNAKAQLEALLFAYGEAMPVGKIARALDLPEPEARDAIAAFAEELRTDGRGLTLLESGGSVELATKPEFHELIERFVKGEMQAELTPAAAETLAIVAYGGPVSRSEIDYVRGVNSSFTVRSLLIRGLIDRTPDPKRTNVFQYRPSFAFLKHIGIPQTSVLPEYVKFQEMIRKIRPEPEQMFNS